AVILQPQSENELEAGGKRNTVLREQTSKVQVAPYRKQEDARRDRDAVLGQAVVGAPDDLVPVERREAVLGLDVIGSDLGDHRIIESRAVGVIVIGLQLERAVAQSARPAGEEVPASQKQVGSRSLALGASIGVALQRESVEPPAPVDAEPALRLVPGIVEMRAIRDRAVAVPKALGIDAIGRIGAELSAITDPAIDLGVAGAEGREPALRVSRILGD